MIGYQGVLLILAIGAFVFGAKRLPEIARSLGEGIKELKKGILDDEDEKK